MKSSSVAKRFGQLASLLALAACTEHEPITAPAIKPVPVSAPHTMSALGSFTGDINAPGGSFLTLHSYSAYPEGIKATITVSGRIVVWSDTRADYFQKTVNAGPGGVFVDGYTQCSVGVMVIFGDVGFGPAPCSVLTNPPGQLPYDTSGAWSVTAVVYGDGSAMRTANIPQYAPPSICDTITCHTYTGSHSITVAPLAGDLDLQVYYALESRIARKALFVRPFNNTDTYAHQRVSFRDTTSPTDLPLRPLQHTWTMMDPTAPNGYWNHSQVWPSCLRTSPPPSLRCDFDVRETGVWASRVRVNGVEHYDELALYCAESEPLLNNDKLRQQLLSALDSSNANDPDFHNRVERYFFVLQDSVTPGAQPYLAFTPRQPTDDVCYATTPSLPAPLLPPNTKVLGFGHEHPSESFVVVKCRDQDGNQTIPRTTAYGASNTDIVEQRRFNAVYPNAVQFIIDKHNVYIVRPGANLGDEHLTGNEVSWDGLMPPRDDRLRRRCGWPKKTVY